MKTSSLVLTGFFLIAPIIVLPGHSQTTQGPSIVGSNRNVAVPNSGAISPAAGARPATGTPAAAPVTGGTMPNTRTVIPPSGTIAPGGSRTFIPNTGMSAPNQPYTNNGVSGNYGHLGPNGFYTPGTNGFYTPGTNGFYTPGTNGFYTPGTNGFYQGPTGGNYLATPTNGFGGSTNQ